MLCGQCSSQGRVLGLDVVAEEALSVRLERREAAGTTDTGHVSRRVISCQRSYELKAKYVTTLNKAEYVTTNAAVVQKNIQNCALIRTSCTIMCIRVHIRSRTYKPIRARTCFSCRHDHSSSTHLLILSTRQRREHAPVYLVDTTTARTRTCSSC